MIQSMLGHRKTGTVVPLSVSETQIFGSVDKRSLNSELCLPHAFTVNQPHEKKCLYIVCAACELMIACNTSCLCKITFMCRLSGINSVLMLFVTNGKQLIISCFLQN